jgi:hypothetical protein
MKNLPGCKRWEGNGKAELKLSKKKKSKKKKVDFKFSGFSGS